MPRLEQWLEFFSNPNREIRFRAASAILDRGDEAPLDVLIEILKSLSMQGLGAKTEKILLKRQDVELAAKMIDLLSSREDFVREVACNVLGKRGGTSATSHLLRMLDDPAPTVRTAAGFGLASLKDKSALGPLRKQLARHSQDDINVVMAIERALRSLDENAVG